MHTTAMKSSRRLRSSLGNSSTRAVMNPSTVQNCKRTRIKNTVQSSAMPGWGFGEEFALGPFAGLRLQLFNEKWKFAWLQWKLCCWISLFLSKGICAKRFPARGTPKILSYELWLSFCEKSDSELLFFFCNKDDKPTVEGFGPSVLQNILF